MRFHVRHAEQELTLPSFADLASLYRVQFISDDDMVRREGSERWMRVGDLPELRALHLYDRSSTRRAFNVVLWLLLGAFAVAVTVQLFLSRRAAP